MSSSHGHSQPVPWESTWTKLAAWGGTVFVVAIGAAYLRHWQSMRVARVRRAEAIARERELREQWVRIARVAGDEGATIRLATTDRRASIDALPGIMLAFEDGTYGVLRAGVPIVGLSETASGTARSIEVAANEPFWIAARPATLDSADDASDAHPFREMTSTPELEPYGETYQCAIGVPLRLGPALPSVPRFRPWALLAYAVFAGVVALLPLETAMIVGLLGSLVVLFCDGVATAVAFMPPDGRSK